MKTAFLKRPRVLIPLILVLALVMFLALRQGATRDQGIETYTVERTAVEYTVSETGVVEAAQDVSVGFAASGRISNVRVSTGGEVESGQTLVSIDGASEYASLLSAQAQLEATQAELDRILEGATEADQRVADADVRVAETNLENARDNLENTRKHQDKLVENARRRLYSEDLQAYLTGGGYENSLGSYTPPTISGTYTAEEEGEYRIKIYPSSSLSDHSFRYRGLESGTGSVSTVQPQPLGDRGLYIEFPEDFAHGYGVEWVAPVPNVRSSTYVQRLGAYEAAREAQTSAIEQAQAQVESAEESLSLTKARAEQSTAPAESAQVSAQEASVSQARAALKQAEVAYADTTLAAPFTGVVADVLFDVGEFVSPGASVVELVSNADYQISVNIPEVDIEHVEVGDEVDVSLDAYDGVVFPAEVVAVSPRAETIGGVTVVETTIQISEKDERIKSGLSADVDILSERREGVFVVPARAVIERDEETYVRRYEGDGRDIESIEQVSVETGLRGSDGSVEIKSGLSEGDVVVTFLPEDIRNKVEAREERQSSREGERISLLDRQFDDHGSL